MVDLDKKIGEGREAEVYTINRSTALLLFKDETHPDNKGDSQQEIAARERLQTMQTKLPALQRLQCVPFVCAPQELVFDQRGTIIGYTMEYIGFSYPLTDFTRKSFRRRYAISNNTVMEIFRRLHISFSLLHARGVIIGDCHPDNILVSITPLYARDGIIGDCRPDNILVSISPYVGMTSYDPYLIDAHSYQIEGYPCVMFKPEYIDPLLCDSTARDISMTKPYTQDSDWYAFAAMLMECLIYSHPYGGVYVAPDPKRRVPDSIRPLQRITVFHPDVRYDRDALPYDVLPDNLLCYFLEVFEEDKRGAFPLSLLSINWQVCPICGTEKAIPCCPVCFLAE